MGTGGARKESTRTASPFAIGVAGVSLKTASNIHHGRKSSALSTGVEQQTGGRPMTVKAACE